MSEYVKRLAEQFWDALEWVGVELDCESRAIAEAVFESMAAEIPQECSGRLAKHALSECTKQFLTKEQVIGTFKYIIMKFGCEVRLALDEQEWLPRTLYTTSQTWSHQFEQLAGNT